MPSICFLVSTRGDAHNDNHRRLPAAFAARGWQVAVADHNDVRLQAGEIRIATRSTDAFDLIWILGLGERASFLDRMQLLNTVSPLKFVVSPGALLQLHAKYMLPMGPLAEHHPETHAGCNPELLKSIVAGGGTWIAKPAAGSFGRDVYRLTGDDPNLDVILESLTGHDRSRYCVVQRYVEAVEDGEKRLLVAAGRVITSYLRLPQRDHRANLAADATAEPTALSPAEAELGSRCARWLADQGAGFAAVDMAHPWIVEFNIANPGGLQTVERLTGQDHTGAVVDAIVAGLAARNQ